MKKAYLVLEDGHVFEGYSFGAEGKCVGELVFNTQTVGYAETLTDPAYYGQIVLQTFPMVGNYGVIEEDLAGEPKVSGYVVREYCRKPSNFRCDDDIDTYLKKHNIPGIFGVDTRQITKIIREGGVMNACICDEIPRNFDEINSFKIVDAVAACSCDSEYTVEPEGETKYEVTLVDYGSKSDIIKALTERGCKVRVVPYSTTADEILANSPDGIVLSGGAGDPAENVFCIEQLRALMGKCPMFGVALGHELMALADGGMTYKLKYGHRGSNQPVREAEGTKTYITAQNHGYAVASDSTKNGKTSYINVNDKSCEGIEYEGLRAFSVQFNPDSWKGQRGTAFLYDKFIEMMGGNR